MDICTHLNVNKEDINKKKFNIFVGLSLGNKYFSDDNNVKEFIGWALDNSKNKIVILIPDTIHAINLEIRNGYSKTRAINYVIRKGEEMKHRVIRIIEESFSNQKDDISIVKFEEIEKQKDYQKRRNVFYEEFENNKDFQDKIIEIVKESAGPKVIKLNNNDLIKLSSYPLDEAPILVAGFKYDGLVYDLIPYPGLSKLDYLIVDLQEGRSFPKITKKLKINHKVAIIEAYAGSMIKRENLDISFKIAKKTDKLKKDVMAILHQYPDRFVHGLFEESADSDFQKSDIMIARQHKKTIGCLMFDRKLNEFNWLAVSKYFTGNRVEVARKLFESFYSTIKDGTLVHFFVNTEDAKIKGCEDFSGKNFESARNLYKSMGLRLKPEDIIKNHYGEGSHVYKVEWKINTEK